MWRWTWLVCTFVLTGTIGCSAAPESKEDANTPVTRIGIYDSRAIAVAFVGSEVYKLTAGKELADMMAEHRKAEAESNTERVEELKAWGATQQELLHKQGFSTAPVDDILAHIADQLPGIRKQANVELLLSKWDTKALTRHESAELIDVTMRLLEAFKPNQRQKKSAIEIQKHDPIPLEKDTECYESD